MRSGVILVDMNYDNKKGRNESCTASRELREESANLICISPNSLETCPKYIQIDRRRKMCYYFVGINSCDIDLSLFENNRRIIRKYKDSLQCWKETQHIRVFYISDIKDMLQTSTDMRLRDVNELVELQIALKFRRLFYILEEYVLRKSIPRLDIIKSGKDINSQDSIFLKGTTSFLF